MTITSYAQNFEDVILWRALKHVERGFYIDVGAQDPVIDSVSLAFYEHGWRGVHIEPNTEYAGKLRLSRPDEDVLQVALGRKEGVITFFEFPDTGLSTCDEEVAQKHMAAGWTVHRTSSACLPLASILDAHEDKEIHWLKVDVEGLEEAVIDGWSPSKVRPWIVVVESTIPNSPEQNHMSWEFKLLELGYVFVYFDGLNRFYVSAEHSELKSSFGPGPNFFDDFALSGKASAPFCHKINIENLKLRERLNVAETEATDGRARLDTASREIEALRGEAEDREQEIAALRGEAEVRKQEIAALRGEAEAHKAEIADLTDSLAAVRQELHDVHQSNHHPWQLAEARGQEVAALRASTSWRVTAPLRVLSGTLRWILRAPLWFIRGVWAWITLKPGSRPRRVARGGLQRLAHFVLARPGLAHGARGLFHRLPGSTKDRLRTIAFTHPASPPVAIGPVDKIALSARAREIHAMLKTAIERRKRDAA